VTRARRGSLRPASEGTGGLVTYLSNDVSANDTPSSEWGDVVASIGSRRLLLGPYFTHLAVDKPRRLLHLLSYYKFAAKMIGAGKRVLEIGCSEGLGTVLLAEHAAACVGIDLHAESIAIANETVANERLTFRCDDVFIAPLGRFDAAVGLDIIEHIPTEHEDRFIARVADVLEPTGIFVCGTPNITSEPYASPLTKMDHINLYSADRLRDLMLRHFENVLLFSANDELVHTGFAPMAHYLLAVCIAPKRAAPSA
jgi:SAM-dependent methyltransferase